MLRPSLNTAMLALAALAARQTARATRTRFIENRFNCFVRTIMPGEGLLVSQSPGLLEDHRPREQWRTGNPACPALGTMVRTDRQDCLSSTVRRVSPRRPGDSETGRAAG